MICKGIGKLTNSHEDSIWSRNKNVAVGTCLNKQSGYRVCTQHQPSTAVATPTAGAEGRGQALTDPESAKTSEPSCVADRVLVLWLGVRPETLRWESRVQDTGPPETSWPHTISIGDSSPRDLCLNANTQLHSTTSRLQCWKPHAKQLARQEHNSTH